MRNWLITIALSVLFSFTATTWAADTSDNLPDDIYVSAHALIQSADDAWKAGNRREAYKLYQDAQKTLQSIKKDYPDWNQRLVDFRLLYIKTKIEQFNSSTITFPKKDNINDVKVYDTAAKKEKEKISEENQQKLRIESLEREVAQLHEKLKEAMAARPATADPKELQSAEKTISELQQKNKALRDELETAPSKEEQQSMHDQLALLKAENVKLKEKLDAAIATDLTGDLSEAKKQIAQLQKENASLGAQIAAKKEDVISKKDYTDLQKENVELKSKLESGMASAILLTSTQKENKELQAINSELSKRLERLDAENKKNAQAIAKEEDTVSKKEYASLQKENADLKAKLDGTVSAGLLESTRKENSELKEVNASLNSQLESLRAEVIQKDKAASRYSSYEKRLSEQQTMIEGLNEENKVLRDIASSKGASRSMKVIERLRTKIAFYEREKDPYTEEEFALLQPGMAIRPGSEPDASLEDPVPVKKKRNSQAPVGGAEIAAEAEHEFTMGRFNEAERLFQRLLSMDTNSVYTLGNLGACQIELNKLKEAEINLKRANAQDPEDTYVVNLLAFLSLKNNRLDDAFELLTQSAKLEPTNPETLNYLGMVLMQKGSPKEAEKAFREAIKIAPNYPVPHHNLAVLYATGDPAYPQLALYHYRKAQAAGGTENPEFEKMVQKAIEQSLADKEKKTEE